MKNVLFIAPDISVKGGISTVLEGLIGSKLSHKYNIITVASHIDRSKLRKLIQAVIGLTKTAYYLISKQIAIVHIHGGDLTSIKRKYFYFRLVKLFKKKIIYHFHGASFSEQYPHASLGWKRRIKSLLEDSNIVICLSYSWKTAIINVAPKSNITVVHNATVLPEIGEKSRKASKTVYITFLGLIGERKGIFDLLEVILRLIMDGRNIHLTVGGNGDIVRLHKEIELQGLKNHVTYAGWIVGDAKDKLLRNTDIFVLPSYGEGMPMSILEAMSYAIPVIATNVGGIPELIKDGESGYLVEPGNLDQLLEKMKKLIADENMRLSMGEKGRYTVEKDFSLSEIANKIDDVYESLFT
ncbi:MAG TPA: glycosyltransferase family 4 protein [Smithellaceae bacterium]|nr:glycosyltransferase family 4 protein [Smithellaceae bacterium]